MSSQLMIKKKWLSLVNGNGERAQGEMGFEFEPYPSV